MAEPIRGCPKIHLRLLAPSVVALRIKKRYINLTSLVVLFIIISNRRDFREIDFTPNIVSHE